MKINWSFSLFLLCPWGGGGDDNLSRKRSDYQFGLSLCWARPSSTPSAALLDGADTMTSKAGAVSGQISFRTKTRHGIRGRCVLGSRT